MGKEETGKRGGDGENTGGKHNPTKWYDFLLRVDAARSPMLASDSMMSKVRPLPPCKLLRAVKNTSFPKNAPRRDFRLTLDGDMNRYVWMINNKPVSPDTEIRIREGEVIRFIMINCTMMHHPMHLHGAGRTAAAVALREGVINGSSILLTA